MRPSTAQSALLGALTLILSACPTQVSEEMRQAEAYECPPEECDPPVPEGEGGTIVVEAFEFDFEIVEANVAEGDIEVTLTNVGGVEHNFVIDEAVDGTSVPADDFLPPGETNEGTLSLFAGEYVYYCAVPGHRAAGMEGTIEIPIEPEDTAEGGDA